MKETLTDCREGAEALSNFDKAETQTEEEGVMSRWAIIYIIPLFIRSEAMTFQQIYSHGCTSPPFNPASGFRRSCARPPGL